MSTDKTELPDDAHFGIMTFSHREIVYLEQSMVEGIERYRRMLAEPDISPLMKTRLEEVTKEWKSLLEKSSKIYPQWPRNW